MKVAILDYGVGNIFSLQKALEYIGLDSILTDDENVIDAAHALILPGVGGFAGAAQVIEDKGLHEIVQRQYKRGKSILGICLGMQLLFERSEEGMEKRGFGLLKGDVKRIPEGVKVPHMGWNSVDIVDNDPVFKRIESGSQAYFVHSYYGVPEDKKVVKSVVDYGIRMPAAVSKGNIIGFQFHPEKSGKLGIKLLNNYKEMIV